MIALYNKFKTSPQFMMIVRLASILISEVIIMYILPYIIPEDTPKIIENLADGALLTLLVSPILWLTVEVPLRGETYKAQKRAQEIITSSMSGILTLDESRIITGANPALLSILGLSLKDVLKKNYNEVLYFLKDIDLTQMTEKHFNVKLNSDEEKSLRVKTLKVASNDGFICTLFIDDETGKKRAEQALEAQKANAVASARLATLGEMAGGIAHEINTPLNILKLFTAQIAREATEAMPDLNQIEKTTVKMDNTIERMSGIVRGMRSMFRDGSQDQMSIASVKQIVGDVLGLIKEKFHNHNVELRIKEISQNLCINCRAVEIGQVILNFLNNSFDAIEAFEKKWIEINAEQKGSNCEIYITDCGHGIPSEIAEKMFNPFFTTKEIGKGTGLGLSISAGIIRTHGGSVQINKNSPNTQFIITFPIANK